MFLLDNILYILLAMAMLFLLFTFLNIYTFGKDLLTSVFLTVIFFDLFFKMPFKAVNIVYSERKKIIGKLGERHEIN